ARRVACTPPAPGLLKSGPFTEGGASIDRLEANAALPNGLLHRLLGPTAPGDKLLRPIVVVNEGFSGPVADTHGETGNRTGNRPDAGGLGIRRGRLLPQLLPVGRTREHKIGLKMLR